MLLFVRDWHSGQNFALRAIYKVWYLHSISGTGRFKPPDLFRGGGVAELRMKAKELEKIKFVLDYK